MYKSQRKKKIEDTEFDSLLGSAGRTESNIIWVPVIEDEVIVQFLEGDPDRPIITGRVYNAEEMPPYTLPDGTTITGIKVFDSSSMLNTNIPNPDILNPDILNPDILNPDILNPDIYNPALGATLKKQSDERINAWIKDTDVTMQQEKVTLQKLDKATYQQPDDLSRVKVKFPWILEELVDDPDKPVVLKGIALSDSHGVLIINKNDESGQLFLKILESQLQDEISKAEADRETVRNDRQMTSTQFENANQKASQYINMLSSILKTMNEMNQGIIRNLR